MGSNTLMKLIILALVLVSGGHYVSAQGSPPKPKTISGGILNGKATQLPKPNYPEAAKAVKASGQVKIQVLIDEEGNVISAQAVSGHPLLRAGSEAAAREARFAPTLLSGVPVKVSGVITYNYVLPAVSYEEELDVAAVSAFLFMVREMADDLDRLNQIMESSDFIAEIVNADDYGHLKGEGKALLSAKTLPQGQRIAAIDSVIDKMSVGLKAKDEWQYFLGKNLGELFASLMKSVEDDGFDPDKLNIESLRSNLVQMKGLVASVRGDFPPAVLDKLKIVTDMNETPNLNSIENISTLLQKLTALMDTISPDHK